MIFLEHPKIFFGVLCVMRKKREKVVFWLFINIIIIYKSLIINSLRKEMSFNA